jgi:hypothetical protein
LEDVEELSRKIAKNEIWFWKTEYRNY